MTKIELTNFLLVYIFQSNALVGMATINHILESRDFFGPPKVQLP